MRKGFSWLAIALLDLRSSPPPSLVAVFTMGLLIFSILGNAVYDVFANESGLSMTAVGRITGAVLVLLLVAAGLFMHYLRGTRLEVNLRENDEVPSKGHVITALSPLFENQTITNFGTILGLLHQHQSRLQVLYLVSMLRPDPETGMARDEIDGEDAAHGVRRAYDALLTCLEGKSQPAIRLIHIVNTDSAQDTFDAVYPLLVSLLERYPEDVLVDVTAGKKSMTVGLTSAAFTAECPISYLTAPRTEDGRPRTDQPPVYVMLDSGVLAAQVRRRALATAPPVPSVAAATGD